MPKQTKRYHHPTGIKPIVRESKRAKHVSLKMSLQGELTVVIPPGFDRRLIPKILHKKRSWIDKVHHKIEKQRRFSESELPAQIPERIILRAIGQEWLLKYESTGNSGIFAEEHEHNNLLISGDIENNLLCKKMLQRWIFRKAQKHLIPWLDRVSEELELPFSRATVRNQRTRWGSCSQYKSISINQKILFFPPHLVRYIFIHELCHTVHLNHSFDFWTLVHQKEPQYKKIRKEVRLVRKYIPGWSEL